VAAVRDRLPRTRRLYSVRLRNLAAVALCAVAILMQLCTGAGARPARCDAAREGPLALTVASGARPGAPIPPDFLGLSLETPALHLQPIETASPQLSNLLSGLGTGVLRVSGDSVDRTQWLPAPGPAAPWAITTETPEDLRHLATLVGAARWQLLLGIDLGHPDPAAVVEEASAARSILGSSLAGVAIGNEPELWTLPPAQPLRAVLGASPLRPAGWGVADYEREAAAMRAALAAAGASVPLYGPESATGDWLAPYAAAEGSRLTALTAHLYPLDRCHDERLLARGPSIEELLSAAQARGETVRIEGLVSAAERHRLPLRIDELGSVACAGQPGTSDTFAGALWALDVALIAAREGVAGVNFSGGLGSCQTGGTILSPWYSPLCTLADGQLSARPEYYALLLLHALEGDAFLPLTLDTARDIAAFALRAPDGDMRVVIDDMEASAARPGVAGAPHGATVTLDVGAGFRHAKALWLRAPSVSATQGTTLGDATLRPDGTLPSPRAEPLAGGDGHFVVHVRPASAALVTLAPGR
jgi:hypothetical protein